jgi:hypothetical protein
VYSSIPAAVVAALAVEGTVETFQHGVHRVGQVLDLVIGSGEADAFVQAAVGDSAGGGADLLQGAQRVAGHQPPERGGDNSDDAEGYERGDEHAGAFRRRAAGPDNGAGVIGVQAAWSDALRMAQTASAALDPA